MVQGGTSQTLTYINHPGFAGLKCGALGCQTGNAVVTARDHSEQQGLGDVLKVFTMTI